MTTINHNNQTVRVMGLLFVALLALSACKRSSVSPATSNTQPDTSQPVRVSSGDADAAEPTMAAAPDGSVYVAWVSHQPNSHADVMIARLTREGKMQGSAARVNLQPGVATAWRGDPPTVAVAPDNTVFVGWTARVESDSGHTTNIYLSSSSDLGQTFGAPVKVNDDATPAVHGMHSLAVGKDGRIYLAWLDERNVMPMPMNDKKMDPSMKGHHMESNRELFVASSTDSGRTFTTNQRVATDVCPCCKTALAVDSNGRLYVSWRQVLPGDLRHIAVSSSSDQGKTFTTPKIVSDDQWVLAGCPVSGAALSVDKNNVLRVLWYSAGKNGQTGLYWSESKDQGISFGPRTLVAAGSTGGTPVLLSDGDTLSAVWEGSEGNTATVMTAALTTDTVPAEKDFVVTNGELPASVMTKSLVMVAYVAKTDQRQGVWVVSAHRNN
ncbi:MAG: sialidase family protein [Pyrinomonadaceae bacterium]